MFSHLHVHTEYSMLDGLSRIEPLVRRAKELGMDSLAITDHGGMYGAIDFYQAATQAGVKPIIGCEMYVAPGSRHDRSPSEKTPYHLTVLARDATGYRNLVKLATKAQLEGFYYKPRVDREVLQQHSDGLVVLSGCPSGEVPSLISQGRVEEAAAAARWYREVFDEYYFELMEHGGVPELPAVNKGLMRLHGELDIPLVATNDTHYVSREDAPLQDILICIHTNTNIQDEKRLRMVEDSYYLKSPQEMETLFADIPEAVANTERIAEMSNLKLDFSQLRLPEFQLPEGITADGYLEQLARDGLRRRLDRVTEAEESRLAYELEVIKQTRYANYCLVVWDIARFVRENDIFFAVRGSAASSLTLFCLGATDVNPLPYGLVFERFLHVDRKEMPDIDMDFQDDRREEVINYVVSKYGKDHVAQIITFGTLGARASIRDVGRALAMPYADVDRVARLVPFKLHITLDEAREQSPELAEIYGADQGVRKLVDTARQLEGLTRHSSTHAAGVVISKDALDDVVPLQRPIKGGDESVSTTQYSMGPIAALGYLQMDFLGLVNLTVLARARDVISRTRGVELALRDIPLDDPKTFDMLSKGETGGVFQLEGTGMTRHITELKPSSLSDVSAMIALYRPGPMEHIQTFIDAKHGRVEPKYPHPALRDILEETYGVIVYQEQVLLIARTFAGYTMGEADIVRKAMGKKVPEIMAQEREKFVQGALKQGYSQELADQVFALIEPFAGYAFAKSHSVSYALISYWTAYLKATYPAEYMVSLLNSYIANTERVTSAVAVCRGLKIPVLAPDINSGDAEFSIEPLDDGRPAVRYGLAAIKNVGAAAVRPLIEGRSRDEPYTSIEHMCRSADLAGINRKTLESLIKAGALDTFGDRGALLGVVDRILSLAHSEADLKDSNQSSMFDMFGESVPTPLANISLPESQTTDREKQAWEREVLGLALSNPGLLNSLTDADPDTIVFRSDLGPEMARKKVVVRGQVASVTQRFTRDQKPFTIAMLTLMDGDVDVLVWQDQLEATSGLWEQGKLVVVVGTVRARGDEVSISCREATEYKLAEAQETPDEEAGGEVVEAPDQSAEAVGPTAADRVEPVHAAAGGDESVPSVDGTVSPDGLTSEASRLLSLRILESDKPAEDRGLLDEVSKILLEYDGEHEVRLEIATAGRVVALDWPLVRVNASPELERRLQELLGPSGVVSIETVTP